MRVHGEPLAILPAARKVVQQMDPESAADSADDPARAIRYDDLSIRFSLRAWPASSDFWQSFWSGTGLYGTLAYRVSMRTAEIGVRMAVGARREQVVWMILKDSLAAHRQPEC